LSQTPELEDKLKPQLGLFSATSLVIGCVIGSGIFVSSAGMAKRLGSAPLLLLVWVVGGFFTLLGALTLCELTGQMPGTGGLYTYLREIYGDAVGYFYGWANLTVGNTGSIAAIAYIFGAYLSEFIPLPHLSPALEKVAIHLPYLGDLFPLQDIGIKGVAALLICGLTYLNIRGVKLSTLVQTISMSAKVLAMIVVIAVALIWGGHTPGASTANWIAPGTIHFTHWTWLAAVTAALSGAFWSYDGWGGVAYVGGEVKQAEKTLPRAIILGSICFITLYLVMNLAYLYVLPIQQLGAAPDDRVASVMVSKVWGHAGGILVALLVLLSTFDNVNASILICGRVFYAMAREGLFLKSVGEVHPKYGTPSRALLHQCAWCLILLFSGSFDLVTSMYVFVSWLLYLLMGIGVFILRFREPNRPRPFRVPGYPWIPALFVLFTLVFLVLTLAGDITSYANHEVPVINSVVGLLFVFSGTPLYLYILRQRKSLARKAVIA
jgi:APA family basic amino acid/polyamine antiporter